MISLRFLELACPAVFCAGLNFASHATETGLPLPKFPIWTMKNPSSIITTDSLIRIPAHCRDEVDFEGELAVIIARDVCNVSEAEVASTQDPSIIDSVTCALDMTARKWQGKKGGHQWCYAKSFDTFCPLGPKLVPWKDFATDFPPQASLTTQLNGETMQKAELSEMHFSIPCLVSSLSKGMTLRRGTVILTGTPAGVGYVRRPTPRYVQSGDRLMVSCTGLGTLRATVA